MSNHHYLLHKTTLRNKKKLLFYYTCSLLIMNSMLAAISPNFKTKCSDHLLPRSDLFLCIKLRIKRWRHEKVPSRELTYPTWGIGKSSSKCHFGGDMLVPWRATISLGHLELHKIQASCHIFWSQDANSCG